MRSHLERSLQQCDPLSSAMLFVFISTKLVATCKVEIVVGFSSRCSSQSHRRVTIRRYSSNRRARGRFCRGAAPYLIICEQCRSHAHSRTAHFVYDCRPTGGGEMETTFREVQFEIQCPKCGHRIQVVRVLGFGAMWRRHLNLCTYAALGALDHEMNFVITNVRAG